jgi:hypothetical protein
VFSPGVKNVGIWFPALLGLIVASRFIAMIGVWHMKKWGILLFYIAMFMKLYISVVFHQLSVIEIVLCLYLGGSFIFFFRKMDSNL